VPRARERHTQLAARDELRRRGHGIDQNEDAFALSRVRPYEGLVMPLGMRSRPGPAPRPDLLHSQAMLPSRIGPDDEVIWVSRARRYEVRYDRTSAHGTAASSSSRACTAPRLSSRWSRRSMSSATAWIPGGHQRGGFAWRRTAPPGCCRGRRVHDPASCARSPTVTTRAIVAPNPTARHRTRVLVLALLSRHASASTRPAPPARPAPSGTGSRCRARSTSSPGSRSRAGQGRRS
jgi:hypothetical protein